MYFPYFLICVTVISMHSHLKQSQLVNHTTACHIYFHHPTHSWWTDDSKEDYVFWLSHQSNLMSADTLWVWTLKGIHLWIILMCSVIQSLSKVILWCSYFCDVLHQFVQVHFYPIPSCDEQVCLMSVYFFFMKSHVYIRLYICFTVKCTIKIQLHVSSFIDFAFWSYRSSSYVCLCLSKMCAVKHISCLVCRI